MGAFLGKWVYSINIRKTTDVSTDASVTRKNQTEIKSWDCLAERPKREHVATAEREHRPKNAALEADDSKWSLPTSGTPMCRKLQNGIEKCSSTKRHYSHAATKLQLAAERLEQLAKLEEFRLVINKLENKIVFLPNLRTEDPSTHAKGLGTRGGCGRPKA